MSASNRFPVKKKTMAQTNAIMIHSSDVNTTVDKGVDAQKSVITSTPFMRPVFSEGAKQAPDLLAGEGDHPKKLVLV